MVQQQDWTHFSLQRPNYFPGQYLLDEDFELAHQYLSDRQRYINCRLHLAGIVEGLEVKASTEETAITIEAGTALDSEGYLMVLPEEQSDIKVSVDCWVCLRYHHELKLLQQPDIADSFTRIIEFPKICLETVEPNDPKNIILAKVTLENNQIQIDSSMREYSGVRLPSGKSEEINLKSDGQSLAIKGNLSVTGQLQFGDRSAMFSISEQIDTESDRITVVPSEKAVKYHLEKRIVEQLIALNQPTQEKPTISLSPQPDGKLYGWKIDGSEGADPSSILKLISCSADLETPRITIERDTGNVGIGTTTPQKKLEIVGTLRARHLESSNPMRHRMYPNDAIVYQDIFEARDIPAQERSTKGGIAKYKVLRNPINDAETRHSTQNTLWNSRRMICYGNGDEDDAGAVITIPKGYDTLWVRLNAVLFHCIKAQRLDGAKEDLGRWTAGKRNLNCYCPDGSLTDGYARQHQWLPIPAGQSGQVTLVSKTMSGLSNVEFWVSGLGFSKNPWAHATQAAIGYHKAVNGGQVTGWDNDSWNDDTLAKIDQNTNLELMVPYVWSGRDKLLYIIEHNNDWNGCAHVGITVNGQAIGRLTASYDNPFARHWNSKIYNRYIAARIPAALIPKPVPDAPPVLRVRIDMRGQGAVMFFREIGTHDLELPEYV